VSDDGGKVPVERAVELFVYAPVGVALYLRDTVPTFVNLFVSRGRSEVRKRTKDARRHVTQAKSMGEFAVEFGGPKILRKVEDGVSVARKSAETVLANLASSETDVVVKDEPSRPTATARPTQSKPPAPAPSPAAGDAVSTSGDGVLAIPDYDELSASQVVERLEGLRRDELDAVREYEAANRGRRTILFKIEQLTH
jgi:hypothetical protein